MTTFSTPGGQQVADELHQGEHARGGGGGGLKDDAVVDRQGGASFQAAIRKGKFQGTICPHSRRWARGG